LLLTSRSEIMRTLSPPVHRQLQQRKLLARTMSRVAVADRNVSKDRNRRSQQ
jgi:hypothetical protein